MRKIFLKNIIILSISFLFLFTLNVSALQFKEIERVSINSTGIEGNDHSIDPSISSDGRYIVFASAANNLVPGDTNAREDIFVYDRNTDTLERVSVDNAGLEGNNNSSRPSISSDGRYIAFVSTANNLVAGDVNGNPDIFVYDKDVGTIILVSSANDGTPGDGWVYSPAISLDGRYVSFFSDSSNLISGFNSGNTNVYVYDTITGLLEIVSISENGAELDDESSNQDISSDGRYVSFSSYATNVVSGYNSGNKHSYVYDRELNTVEIVSISNDNIEGDGDSTSKISISSDGKYISYSTYATNLVPNDVGGFQDIFLVTRYNPAPPSSGGQSGVRFICKDPKATNYNPTQFGRHKQSMCKYKEVETSLDIKECPHFTKYFRFGDKDREIGKIQTFLQEQGINTGYIDSIMGPITFNAIKQFQQKYFNEILKPWNLNKPTGRWYQSTRHKANQLAGCPEGSLTLDNGVVITD